MKIDRNENPDGIIFTVTGALTGLADSGVRLFEKINHELESGQTSVIIDLEKSLFVDSIAVGLIMGVMLKASGLGKSVTMVHVPEQVAQVFDSIHLKKAFPNAY